MSDRLNYWQRRRFSRRSVLYGATVAAGGAAAFAAVGCGDDDDDGGSKGGGDTSAPAAAGTVRPTPTPLPQSTTNAKSGGTLNLVWAVADAQLDPHSTTEHLSPDLYRAASHGLLKQKAVTEEPEADLAEKWEKPDPLTIVFHLNPAAKWQNKAPVNGRAVTAEDVVYSLKRISTPGPAAPRASSFALIDSFTATDPKTVTIKLKQPFVPILVPLSDKWTVIVAKEVVDQFGDLKRGESIIGCGPFICESAESSKGATLVRNPDYWGTKAYLDKVVYTTVLDAEARQAAYKSGQIDILSALPDLLIDSFKSNDTGLVEFDQTGVVMSLIGGPNDKAPLNDERVRKAINLVIDRTQIGRPHSPARSSRTPACSLIRPGACPWPKLPSCPASARRRPTPRSRMRRTSWPPLASGAASKSPSTQPRPTTSTTSTAPRRSCRCSRASASS